MDIKYINIETGEIFDADKSKSNRIQKLEVDDMLKEAKTLTDIDDKMLYSWCKITGELNGYNQMKISGAYRNGEVEDKVLEDVAIAGYVFRTIKLAHPFTGMIMFNRQTYSGTWSDLYQNIECKSKTTQGKLKKILTDLHIVRVVKIPDKDKGEMTRFIINPFFFRGAQHTSQIATFVFQDFSEPLCEYVKIWAKCMGLIGNDKKIPLYKDK